MCFFVLPTVTIFLTTWFSTNKIHLQWATPTLTFNIIKLCTYNTYFNIIFIEILTFVIRLKKYTLSNFTCLIFTFHLPHLSSPRKLELQVTYGNRGTNRALPSFHSAITAIHENLWKDNDWSVLSYPNKRERVTSDDQASDDRKSEGNYRDHFRTRLWKFPYFGWKVRTFSRKACSPVIYEGVL